MRRLVMAGFLLFLFVRPVAAQWVVYDPIAVAKTIEVVRAVYAQIELLDKTLTRWDDINQNLPIAEMQRYRLPPIEIGKHDVTKHPFATALLQGLNGAGDPRGDRWAATVPAVTAAYQVLASLPQGPARTELERAIAGIEISDSLAQRSVHQVGLTRTFSGEINKRIQVLTDDVTSSRRAHNYATAILGKLSGASVIAQNQAMVSDQMLSHLLELNVADFKAMRDMDAQALDLRIQDLLYGEAAAAAMLSGAGATIRNWRTR